jgi:glycosyltransferase involved in cell wall biosynthesis
LEWSRETEEVFRNERASLPFEINVRGKKKLSHSELFPVQTPNFAFPPLIIKRIIFCPFYPRNNFYGKVNEISTMNDTPLISVIIPTHNYGSFIGDAIESVLVQDYPQESIEIIVVDDGSTDNTREVIRKYASGITYLYSERKGVAAARNRGISLAKGQIITFLDADDIWLPMRTKRVAEALAQHADVGIVFHNFDVIDSGGKPLYKDFSETFYPQRNRKGPLLSDIIKGNVFCGASSFSFRRALLKEICPIPEDIRRGVDFYLTAIAACYAQAWHLPETLGLYRLHHENLTFLVNANPSKSAQIHRDLSHTYEKLSARLSHASSVKREDIKTLRRRYSRSLLLSAILSGKRLNAIKQLPALFKSAESPNEFYANIGLLLITLLVPNIFYTCWVKFNFCIKKVLH